MKFAIYNAAGEILRTGQCPDKMVALQAGEGEFVYEGEATEHDRVDPATGALVVNAKPPQPSPFHDWVDGAWVGNLERLRASKAVSLEQERARRAKAPIEIDGASYHADPASRQNVTDKLGELRMIEEMELYIDPQILFWRDVDKQIHTFDTPRAYKNFLGYLLITASSRNSELYAWKWERAAELASLATCEQVEAFDPAA